MNCKNMSYMSCKGFQAILFVYSILSPYRPMGQFVGKEVLVYFRIRFHSAFLVFVSSCGGDWLLKEKSNMPSPLDHHCS